MKTTVLIDNIGTSACIGEWGLSFFISYQGMQILLDAGTSGKITENASVLGIDLSGVDAAVLSHAHYDHADGLEAFLSLNQKAYVYIRTGAEENCYAADERGLRYIGIKTGFLKKNKMRVAFISGDFTLMPGVFIIPHKTDRLELLGDAAGMLKKQGGELTADNFDHEQSLVFETEKGLVIFNSCSHGGVDNIVREVQDTFPDKHIYAYVGGMHLYRTPDEEVRKLAGALKELEIDRIITGHCTGEEAYAILKEELGDKVLQMYSGYTFEV